MTADGIGTLLEGVGTFGSMVAGAFAWRHSRQARNTAAEAVRQLQPSAVDEEPTARDELADVRRDMYTLGISHANHVVDDERRFARLFQLIGERR